jgi:cysteine desulfurase
MRRVYLDSNATTPLLPEVLEEQRPYFVERFGNASSIHQQGQGARAAVEHGREQVAALLNCRASEVVFTSGGTEGDNLALFGMVTAGDHIITSAIEHHAVLHACRRLEALGCQVTYLPVDGQCLVNPDDVRRALRPATKLITIMMANNETGAIQPVQAIGRIAVEADVWFHTDAVQAAGKIQIDVNRINCDLLSISSHKFHGPQGAGALFVRRGTLLQPLFYGGRHERGRRAGTENVAGIVGMGKAAEIARADLRTMETRIGGWRDRIENTVLQAIEATGVNAAGAPRTPNTANIWFDWIEGEALVIALDLKGFAVSTGTACSSGATEPSHVLTAMSLSPERARGSMRFSLGKQNTDQDVDEFLAVLPEVLARLRELSPAYRAKVAVG